VNTGRRLLGRPRCRWEGGENNTGFVWLRIVIRVVGCFECCNEPAGFIQYGEFLDWLKNS
jgi:hypothetical protein